MNKLKVCFIGIGSIAKRHIRNLHIVCEERKIELCVDAYRRSPVPVDGVETVYSFIESVPNDYDAIFITNPTDLHIDTLKAFHEKANCFFIEKPLTSIQRIEEVKDFKFENSKMYYVACPLRYTNVIQYMKKYVSGNRIIGARCISSSYLPEWRPGIDYRNTYSAHKDLGGGVSIDLIHEWDYIKFLFGDPSAIIHMAGKKSDLEIDCEDIALYIAEYPDKYVELHLDYFGRKAIREIELFTPNDTIVGDLITSKISFLKSGDVVCFGEQRDDFQKKELLHFLQLMKTGKSDNTIEDAYNTILLTQGIMEHKDGAFSSRD